MSLGRRPLDGHEFEDDDSDGIQPQVYLCHDRLILVPLMLLPLPAKYMEMHHHEALQQTAR